MGNKIEDQLSKFDKKREQVPHAKYLDENGISIWDLISLFYFNATHNNIKKYLNFSNDTIEKLKLKCGVF